MENTTTVANTQKHGAVRFYGDAPKVKGQPSRLGEMYEVPAGQELEIPTKVWDRYKNRSDIRNMLSLEKIVIGGFQGRDPKSFHSAPAQRAAIAAQSAKLEQERAELEDERAQLEALRAELEQRKAQHGE